MSEKDPRDTVVDLGVDSSGNSSASDAGRSVADVASHASGEQFVLATRGSRFAAYIIDNLIAAIPSYAIATSVFGDQMESLEALINALSQAPMSVVLYMFAANLFCYLVIHGYFLATAGQTIGKKLVNIAVVDVQSERILPFWQLVIYRVLPVWALMVLPLGNLLSLIDVVFIFNKDQRCVHDHIAKTKVVSVDPDSAFNEPS